MKVYLAGGAVRDLLLGNPIVDRDYLVMEATKLEFMKSFPNAYEVGRAFPVFLLDKHEFSFPRGRTVSEELRARDLTVNALLLNENGELLCHPQGLEDLKNKILRPTSLQAFIDDPLRVFRAARFWARFPDFAPHDELIDALKYVSSNGLLNSIASDRVGVETVKALESPAPGNFLRLLAQGNCLSPWFDEFKNSLNISAGPLPYHDTNVLEHTCRVMDGLAGSEITVWMGLCHDIGKTMTPSDELPKHHRHDSRGIDLAIALTQRLRLSNAHLSAGAKASKWHMIAARYDDLRPGTKVDLLMDLHTARLVRSLFTLIQVDQDKDFQLQAKKDLNRILSVKLKTEEMNHGAESGKRLRELRSQKISKRKKK